MPKRFLSLTETAQQLGVSERTIYRLMENGELHPFKMGKSWRFEQSDIDDFIERQRKKTEEEKKEVEV